METKDARKLSPSAQEAIRKRVVDAVFQGMSQTQAAQVFGISRASVNRWVGLFRKQGKRALNNRKRGRPSRIQLAPWQAGVTVRTIEGRNPEQVKLPFALWTREAVAELIERKYGLRLSRWTIGRYLKRWGFSPQKPSRRALEQAPEEVKQWLETDYPNIHRQAHQEGAEIHWGDEMGVRSEHQTGTTYSRKGKTPVVRATGKRFGCNMISTITNRGTLRFMVFKGRFNSDLFLDFLRRLLRSSKRKIYLIIDNHPVHKARKVNRWLEKYKEQILVFYLPPYSPEINPNELLNNDVKSNAVGRKRAANLIEMMANIRAYLRKIQRSAEAVKSYFKPNKVRYADN